jgi:hypothetical protein
MKIIDLDEICNFLVLIFFHLKSLRCWNKGIFDFSHLQFDTVRAQSDGSGMEGKKVWSSGAKVH